jgi:hypothetical protein
MNRLVATTAKRVLGEKRANSCYWFAVGMKSNILWHFTNHDKLDRLNRYEARYCSQDGEDGIIKAIFQRVGVTNKFCVEFGVGTGTECNTAYLVKKRGWSFLWMDAFEGVSEPIQKEYITAENINQLFTKYGVPITFDLLSIDIDYNTYWVWKAIQGFNPRVVVVEYNACFPPTESVVVPYDPHGVWDGGTNYWGASLLALTRLGVEKGYTLVACDNWGVNAFFVTSDLKDFFVSKSIEEIYRPPRYGKMVNGRYIGLPRSNRQFVSM